jgi:glycosyltransferase involved in cell wall biosynthesis
VVAANRAALPETCGNAALLVDPDDPAAIADALQQAVSEAAVRIRLSEAGLRRSAELSWGRTAQRVDAVLNAVTRW